MMFARREHLDVAHEHHLVVIGIEHRGKHVSRFLTQPGELLGHRARHPAWCVLDAITLGVFANSQQDLVYRSLNPAQVNFVVHC